MPEGTIDANINELVGGAVGDFVPFDDIKPRKPYQNYARISFGPSMETLERGLDALERTIATA